MTIVKIEPSTEVKLPYDLSAETADTFLDEMATAANTINLQTALGMELQLDPEEIEQEKKLFKDTLKSQKSKNLQLPNTAFAAAAFLKTYGQQLALDANLARAAITNKLMEIANCGDTKYELKALELLGKHVDIGLFSDRSEITVNYKDPESLEREIKERVRRLLNADVVDVVPLVDSIDEEMGSLDLKNPNRVDIEEVWGDSEPADG